MVKIDSPEALEANLLSDFKVFKNMIPSESAGEPYGKVISYSTKQETYMC